ncbi:MAG TPA: tetratricopeptide repeat protein [Opitutaceae bacterium]|nr:tetratricopeptide repeat protein [Opitutaceae bacterium]
MAEKVNVRVKVILWVIAALAFAAIVAVTGHAWRWFRLPERVQSALPALPSGLSSKSAELDRRIGEADARSRSREHALAGVSELGSLYHANGYLREAEACWRILRSVDSRNGKWSYYLADIRRTAGDGADASSLLAETVHLDPDYAAAWLRLADLEFKTGMADIAERRYSQRLALLPTDPYARLGLARIAMQRGKQEEARRLIEEIIRETPDFPTAHNLYAEMLAADGMADEALRHRNLGRETGRFREADDPWMHELNDNCLDPKRLALLGSMAQQTDEDDRAETLFKRAIELAPDDPTSYEMLGTLYLGLNKPESAQRLFEAALRLSDSADRRVLLTTKLADSFRMQERPEDALRLLRDELSRTPSAYELHNSLGAVLLDLRRVEESVEAYREAVVFAPNDADSNFHLGSGLLALGRRDEGIRHLKQSLTLQPTYPRTLILLGRLALEEGRMDEAYGFLKPLYESNPAQAMARQLLVRYHMRMGDAAAASHDLTAAEEHYRKGLKIEPEVSELNASFGVFLLLQNRLKEALTPIESYHRLRPQDPQASLFLGQLYAQLGRIADARRILTEGRKLAERAGNTATANHCREILEHLPPDGFDPSRNGR